MRISSVARWLGVVGIGIAFALVALASIVPLPVAGAVARCFAVDAKTRTLCYEDALPALYPAYDVRTLMRSIERMQFDPAMRDCHFIAHRLGETAVALDPPAWPEAFVAVGEYDQLCSFGVTHGSAIRAFNAGMLAREGAVERAVEACKTLEPALRERISAASPCAHAIGHLFFFIADKDMGRGFETCDAVFPDTGEGPSNRTRCHTGVAMQFIVPEDYLIDLDDPAYDDASLERVREETMATCRAFENPQHEGACMRGRWPLYAREILSGHGIDSFCAEHPTDGQRFVCYEKLSVTLGWYHVNDIDALVLACRSLEAPGMPDTCLRTAANEIMRLLGGGSRGERAALDVCGYSTPAAQDACSAFITERRERENRRDAAS